MFSCSLAPGQGPERRGDCWDCKAPNPPGCGRPDTACPCSWDQQGAVRPRTSVLVPTSPLPESCQCKQPGVQHGQTLPGTAWSPWVSSWSLCPAPLAWSRNYVCFQRAGGVTSMDIHPQRSLVPSRQDRGAWLGCSGSPCSGLGSCRTGISSLCSPPRAGCLGRAPQALKARPELMSAPSTALLSL